MTTLLYVATLASAASIVLAVVCRLAPMDRPSKETAPAVALHLLVLAMAAWIGAKALAGAGDAAHLVVLIGCAAVLYAARHERRTAEVRR